MYFFYCTRWIIVCVDISYVHFQSSWQLGFVWPKLALISQLISMNGHQAGPQPASPCSQSRVGKISTFLTFPQILIFFSYSSSNFPHFGPGYATAIKCFCFVLFFQCFYISYFLQQIEQTKVMVCCGCNFGLKKSWRTMSEKCRVV